MTWATAIPPFVAFAAGAVVEGLYVYGVQVIAERRAVASGVSSMVWAAMMLLGLDEAMHHGAAAVAWVAGYGFGSWAVVAFDRRPK